VDRRAWWCLGVAGRLAATEVVLPPLRRQGRAGEGLRQTSARRFSTSPTDSPHA
jgi:hypothetical protein